MPKITLKHVLSQDTFYSLPFCIVILCFFFAFSLWWIFVFFIGRVIRSGLRCAYRPREVFFPK